MITNTLRLGWTLLLGLAAPAVLAQDGDGATRAERDAANPLRMIIEAGKLKPRQTQAERELAAKPAPDAKAAADKAPVVAKVAAASPAPRTGTLDAAAVPALASVAVDAPAALAPVAFERRAPPPAEPYDPDDYFGVPPPSKSGAVRLAQAGRLALAVAAPAPAPATEPALRQLLQLADYVEPVVPERVRRRLQSDGEVVLAFTVNADGSVADLAVRSASDHALEEVALDAVRQWRYQPIATAQAHGVQLVFKLRQ
ncbi:MAG: TonB family protein [Ideonella sp.]|nr:TonB family protein [Ideonella sp.]